MTSIAELNATVDRFSRRVDTIIAENAARDAEYKAAAEKRDAEYKAAAEKRDAEYKAAEERRKEGRERLDARLKEERERLDARLKEEREKRDAEYKAAEERRKEEREKRDAERNAEWQLFRKEMQAEHKKTEDLVRKISNDFHSQWARFVEALCANQVVPLLREKGIPVQDTSMRRTGRYPGGAFEIDIVAHNGDTIVLVEVKTTLRPDDVRDFVETLSHAREGLAEYQENRILGAVAFLRDDANAAQFAQKKGLFTILATGEGAVITNPDTFAPKAW